MNIRKTLLAVTGAAFVSLSIAALAAVGHGTDANSLIRLSEEGLKRLQSLLLARIAIFDGQTRDAVKLVDQAKVAWPPPPPRMWINWRSSRGKPMRVPWFPSMPG